MNPVVCKNPFRTSLLGWKSSFVLKEVATVFIGFTFKRNAVARLEVISAGAGAVGSLVGTRSYSMQ